MKLKSEEISARLKEKYGKIERVVDAFGRVIGVGHLKPSQGPHIEAMSEGLDGTATVMDPATGKTMEIPKRMPLVIAASVREIDGQIIPFPKTRAELDYMIDVLEAEGMAAAIEAYVKLNGEPIGREAPEKDPREQLVSEAKNSLETPLSDTPST